MGKHAGGTVLVAGGGIEYTQATKCLTDTFSMTGVPGGIPPVICGTNSGYHGKIIHIWLKQHSRTNQVFKCSPLKLKLSTFNSKNESCC